MKIETVLNTPTATTPTNPAAGRVKQYIKSDGIVYTLDSAGTERSMGGGTSSAPTFASLEKWRTD